ncbi:uncharacterized protein TRUGW13939_06674 [Talaromyces rugulosus]|uniref:Cupin 2 conserved barrel domain-containing protein n=1 Tax=Talaromyces rugulosus TaxID=121627 RepID=A0A7H8QZL2_TALRU|nr:uncharacterized protein TRUGW13939_06674 [Talaromyces rugulosus]QKX59540.1 hypothetical protein TRUGW13939_06674 [Talaromyces rugulosus]
MSLSQTNNHLRPISRHTTTNNPSNLVIFHPCQTLCPQVTLPDGVKITFCYGASVHFPIKVANDEDILSYSDLIENTPGIVIPHGIALCIVEILTRYTSPMHRTASVNFNVVMEGAVELILDSGEKRTSKRRDCVIQRVVNHAWRNTSEAEWARISAVPIPAEEFRSREDLGKQN